MLLLELTPDFDWGDQFNPKKTSLVVSLSRAHLECPECCEELCHCLQLISFSVAPAESAGWVIEMQGLNLAPRPAGLYDNVKSPGGTEWVIMSHCFLNYSNFKSTAGKETKNNIIGIWCCSLWWTFFYPRTELALSQGVQWYELLSEHALLLLRNAVLAAKQLIRHSCCSQWGMILHSINVLKQHSC